MFHEIHDSTYVGGLLIMLGIFVAWIAKSMIEECHEELLSRFPNHGKAITRASWAGVVSVAALALFAWGIFIVITEPIAF